MPPSYASMMIAAGVNAKALSTFLGHASIAITFDRNGHLFPGAEPKRPRWPTIPSRGKDS